MTTNQLNQPIRRLFSRVAVMLLVMVLTPATAWAADITQNAAVVINSSNKSTYHNKSITGTVPSSSYAGTFTQSEYFYSAGAIVVDGIDLNLTIDGFTANYMSANSVRSGISLVHGATLHLTILGTNSLRGGYGGAGIAVPDGCTLEITSASTGTLTAIGGDSYGGGAGIGSRGSGNNPNNIHLYPQGCGTITINGGTINATGGTYKKQSTSKSGAAGIGSSHLSGYSADATNAFTDNTYVNNITGSITINGGTVTATGGFKAAGIGGGYNGTVQAITITGGQVTAKGGGYTNDSGAAIGIGISELIGSTDPGITLPAIAISGGKVTANGDMGHGGGWGFIGGSIALGWTNFTDAISASAYYAATVTVANNFMLQGTATPATTANINGRTIVPKVTVSFNANGHGTNPASTATAYGNKINAPAAPSATGYILSGWYKESNCTNEWNFSSDVVTGNITLYAKWVTDPGHITGSGTQSNPYVISSIDQWNTFTTESNYATYWASGTYVELGGYISGITTMAGTESHKFSGNFNGKGYALDINYTNTSDDYCAPFRYTENATITALTVTGTINTSHVHAAGVIGLAYGTTKLENCHSSVNIVSSINGDGTHGGFIASSWTGSTTNINDCIFDGSIQSAEGYTTDQCGGFVGWRNGTINVSNCLLTADISTIGVGTGDYPSCTFVRNGVSCITNSYYINALGTAQGIQAYTSPQAFPCHRATILGVTVYYAADLTPFGKTDSYTPDGTDTNPYIISTTAGWDYFCDALQDNDTWNGFSGKTVKLGENISVTRMAGDDSHCFKGTFDGDGKTLTLNYGTADNPVNAQFVAPFVTTYWNTSPIFRNLTIDGHIYESYAGSEAHNVGGLIGHLYGDVTIEHCTSNVSITSTSGAGGFVGLCEHTVSFTDCLSSAIVHSAGGNNSGFVAWSRASGHDINFEGCLFNGKLLQIGGSGGSNGGFIGWTGSNKAVTITDCLVDPAALAAGETMASTNSATFARGWNATTTATNSYFSHALGTAQGKQQRSITAGENVTIKAIAPVGEATATYSVSGITAYSISENGNGLAHNDILYYGNGDQVSLTLSNIATSPGYQYNGYTVSGGTLTGDSNPYTLTMPDTGDVTVNVDTESDISVIDWATESDGDTEDTAYMIYNKDQLDLLAQRVWHYNYFLNKYFKLGADIVYPHTTEWNDATSTENNYTPIGTISKGDFRGHFDGDGHTISGIRIYRGDKEIGDQGQGLFGAVDNGADIRNIILKDTRITAHSSTGGIVGHNLYGTIYNCHVEADVAIHSIPTAVGKQYTYYHGGIAGYNIGGSITHCTSAASITIPDGEKVNDFGGICGKNKNDGTITDNDAIGVTVAAARDNSYGAIVGTNDGGTLARNYYIACNVAGANNVSGKGCSNSDILANDGAVGLFTLTLDDDITTSAVAPITYNETSYFKGGTEITVDASNVTVPTGYTFLGIKAIPAGGSAPEVTAGGNGTYSFNISSDITVGAIYSHDSDFKQTGDNEYTIYNAAGWGNFCDATDGGMSFSGKTVKLGASIEVTRSAGSGHHFCGTFDGDGKTLTFNYETTTQYAAPFANIDGATIQNLHVDGTIKTSAKYAAGIASQAYGTTHITNCRSSIVISSSVSGDGTHGGLVAGNSGTLTIEGCVFDGKLLTTNGTNNCGGFVGWKGGTLNIKNSIYNPADLATGETEVLPGDGQYMSKTFARTGANTITNSYYTRALGTAQGALARSTTTLPANIGAAGTDYGFVKAYASGLLYDGRYYMTPEAVSLADASANDVDGIDGYFADVKLQGRTLYKDGAWNTLCLPFDVTAAQLAVATNPLHDATYMVLDTTGKYNDSDELDNTDGTNQTGLVGSTLYLYFKTPVADSEDVVIPAGTPFIVKWEGDGTNNLVNPVFSGVTINNASTEVGFTGGKFVGNYNPVEVTADESILFMGTNNTLYYPHSARTINAFRAWFDLGSNEAREFRLSFGHDGEAASVNEELRMMNEEFATVTGWFTLDGRKLQGKPATKGLYIHNGKKVVIK